MKKFEYSIIMHYVMSTDTLKELGNNGWEMCGVEGNGNQNAIIKYYFKREIQQQ